MKTRLVAMWFSMVLSAQCTFGETLRLKLEPDRDILLSGSPQEVTIKIDLAAAASHRKVRRAPLNLAVVLDRSGSMSGPKIEKARQAALGVVDQLAPSDWFSLVVYSDRAQVLVPAQHVQEKEAVQAQINRIHAGGGTALYAGVRTGADQLAAHQSPNHINRVILLSDGLANIGPHSTRDLRELGRALSERGISVTTIGVGDDYNEDLMAGLAEASDANYYYVKDTEKLPQIFAKELGELMSVAAREVRIEITCPKGVRPIGFIGRAERFEGQKATIQLSQFLPGQTRSVFLRCRVEEEVTELAQVRVNYLDEVDSGSGKSLGDNARIRYTQDPVTARNSIRNSVQAEKEWMLTAVAKDQALADADAGRYQQAAERLSAQAAALEHQYQYAPPSLQSQFQEEANNLRSRSDQLRQNQYDSATRKGLQSESYNTRNSKY